MMRRRGDNSGFVLLMVLVVLAVCGTILAASARRCCNQALLAGSAREQLQLKWGGLSCRAVCLPAAERMFQTADPAEGKPVITARRELDLGGIAFELIVSDEQSKANVNVLEKRFGAEGLAAGIHRLQGRSRKALPVKLRPGEPAAGADPLRRRYESFEQVFAIKHPSELVPTNRREDSPVHRLTCWGTGMLNFKRAEPAVLRTVLAGMLTQSQLSDLVKFRQKQPDCTLDEMLRHLKLRKKQAAALRGALTDMSLCHSLWIVAHGKTRSWHRFYIARGGAGAASTEVFEW